MYDLYQLNVFETRLAGWRPMKYFALNHGQG